MRLPTIFLVALTVAACRYTDVDDLWGLVEDADGDGFSAEDDCDDDDADVFPGAEEVCNGIDDDCDTEIDEGVEADLPFYADTDDDGFGDAGDEVLGCSAPEGYVDNADDCDDDANGINPDADEIPDDTIDQDCNGFDTKSCILDADEDGFGTEAGTVVLADDGSCDTADGESTVDTDCDDGDDGIYPGATEIPGDSIDQNCDGSDLEPCYVDADMDGQGDPNNTVIDEDCDNADQSTNGDDCDDSEPTIYDGATEVCDGLHNDCAGWNGGAPDLPDDEVDDDGDDYVECTLDVALIDWGDGTIDGGQDCDDDDPDAYPGAPEVCDGLVTDCGQPLPDDEVDDDDDGYVECTLDVLIGDWGNIESPPVVGGEDCDDTDEDINPGETELCNGIDDDCSGGLPADELDDDGDGYVECTLDVAVGAWGDGTIDGGDDCDDDDVYTYPTAPELCDGTDNNCVAGTTDEAGQVSFEDGVGDWEDWTGLIDGSALTAIQLDEAGTLWFCDGDYSDEFHVNVGGVTIKGRNGRANTALDGLDSYSPIWIEPTVTGRVDIEDLTLTQGGSTNFGGAVYSDAGATIDLYITRCTISESNVTDEGGGLWFGDGSLTVADSTFLNNTAVSGGGLWFEAGTLTVTNTTFETNTVSSSGGGAFINLPDDAPTTSSITNSHFTGNYADDNDGGQGLGGAIVLNEGDLDIFGTDFDDNDAEDSGGAIYIDNSSAEGDVTVTGGTFDGNEARGSGGGAIALLSGTLTVSGATFTSNLATTNDGGAILSVNNSGGVTDPVVTISQSTFSLNDADDEGGALAAFSGGADFTVTDSELTSNTALFGGAIDLDGGTATFTDCDLHGNTALFDSGGGLGGAAYIANADMTCVATTPGSGGVFDNTANDTGTTHRGGGVILAGQSSLESVGCDWGSTGSANDNDPNDVSWSGSNSTNFTDVASFCCISGSGAGCTADITCP